MKNHGPLAHLVERHYGIVEATGSNPVRSTNLDFNRYSYAAFVA